MSSSNSKPNSCKEYKLSGVLSPPIYRPILYNSFGMFATPAIDALAYLFSPNVVNFLSVAAWSIVPSSFLTANLFLSSCVNSNRKLLGNVFSKAETLTRKID